VVRCAFSSFLEAVEHTNGNLDRKMSDPNVQYLTPEEEERLVQRKQTLDELSVVVLQGHRIHGAELHQQIQAMEELLSQFKEMSLQFTSSFATLQEIHVAAAGQAALPPPVPVTTPLQPAQASTHAPHPPSPSASPSVHDFTWAPIQLKPGETLPDVDPFASDFADLPTPSSDHLPQQLMEHMPTLQVAGLDALMDSMVGVDDLVTIPIPGENDILSTFDPTSMPPSRW
jgi:hypothetical protein